MKIIIQKQDIKTEYFTKIEIEFEQVDDCIEMEVEGSRLIIPLEAFFGIFHTTREIKDGGSFGVSG